MKKILFPVMLFITGCGQEFEPDLSGKQVYTLPTKRLYIITNEHEKEIELPGDDRTWYRFPQWTKFQDQILLVQVIKTRTCADYQIVSCDITGIITDTIYTAPPNTALNYKMAPNDSLLILKTYDENCKKAGNYKYTFYNRYLKKALYDTVHVEDAAGVPMPENIWSPDSKKVIIAEWISDLTEAYTYDVVTKDTTYIGVGSNFVWSPTDNDLVAYIKEYSIYGKNIKTKKEELLFEGREKRSAYGFRFSPDGNFLMIHIEGRIVGILPNHTILYYSLPDKIESETYFDGQKIDTWKN